MSHRFGHRSAVVNPTINRLRTTWRGETCRDAKGANHRSGRPPFAQLTSGSGALRHNFEEIAGIHDLGAEASVGADARLELVRPVRLLAGDPHRDAADRSPVTDRGQESRLLADRGDEAGAVARVRLRDVVRDDDDDATVLALDRLSREELLQVRWELRRSDDRRGTVADRAPEVLPLL